MKVLLAVTVIACFFAVCSGQIECVGHAVEAGACITRLIGNGGSDVGNYCNECGPVLARYFRAGCPTIQNFGESEVNDGMKTKINNNSLIIQ